MPDWYVRIIGKRKQELDTNLLVQAVLAMARLLERQQQSRSPHVDQASLPNAGEES